MTLFLKFLHNLFSNKVFLNINIGNQKIEITK